MNNELVIDVASSEISIALLEDKKLVEFTKEKGNIQHSVGDIYLGRVKRIMPALNAAFVDVGHEKDAFIHYLDLGLHFKTFSQFLSDVSNNTRRKNVNFSRYRMQPILEKEGRIQDVLKTGQLIIVQLVKEAISTKGPRLTAEISIAGRNLVLIPFADKVSLSQKISSNEERRRLKRLVESILPPNYGVIVRTAAEGKRVVILDGELKLLIKRWEQCIEQMKTATNPKLLAGEVSRTTALLRDLLNGSFNSIHVNDEETYHEVKDYISTIAPEKEKIVKLYDGNVPIFDQFSITKQVKGSFGKIVSLKGSAYLIIEHTEALHVIDVNSGIRAKNANDQETNALEVNLTAAEEVARQLRLRDMGGIIVVDFIDMNESSNRQMLFEKMGSLMERDRAKHNILPLTKFGLMQITRQRVRPEMQVNTSEVCPTCNGTGKIAPPILFDITLENQVAYYANEKGGKHLTLRVHPFVAAYLTKGLFSTIKGKWARKYKCKLEVESCSSFTFLEYELLDKKGEVLNT
ncbi:MAG: Rne/Rng family ribonuclease [Prevotellaceae bacterium]|jgi:ribonuclease G|nr:Rne/Rng family ribonuclease [Prevotellaceae bacterium]